MKNKNLWKGKEGEKKEENKNQACMIIPGTETKSSKMTQSFFIYVMHKYSFVKTYRLFHPTYRVDSKS